MTKAMQRFGVRLLLGMAVVLELFASAVPFFAERHLSNSFGHYNIVVTAEEPDQQPRQSKSAAATKRMLEIAVHASILAGLIGTMALWAKIEYRWRAEDHEVN